ncbi:MAG: cation transporter [Treponema sp.]|nr:cation transporter [Treponema sp.]
MNKAQYIKVAGLISLFGNLILAVIKAVMACLSSSLALMGDAIDTGTDVLTSILTLVISFIITRPEDKEHPWGHSRSETVATMILSFVIVYAGSQVCINSVKRLVSGSITQEISYLALIAAGISIGGKILLCITQFHYARRSGSDILKANALNMKSDIVLSAGVLVGLLLSFVFKRPKLDPIVAVIVGLWVVKNGVILFWEVTQELIDGNTDKSLYKKLFDATLSVPGALNPHKARIRKMASFYDIDLDFEVDPEMTVKNAHELTEKVEQAIRSAIPEVYDVQIHVEPLGGCNNHNENYGLSPETLKE